MFPRRRLANLISYDLVGGWYGLRTRSQDGHSAEGHPRARRQGLEQSVRNWGFRHCSMDEYQDHSGRYATPGSGNFSPALPPVIMGSLGIGVSLFLLFVATVPALGPQISSRTRNSTVFTIFRYQAHGH